MTDIVERLRNYERQVWQDRLDAADEIEKLRWENANMEKLWGNSEGTWMGIRDKQDEEIELLRKERDGLREQERKMTNHAIDRMAEIERLREALNIIVCNTEPDAIKHRDYDHLAKDIYDCASAALKEKE